MNPNLAAYEMNIQLKSCKSYASEDNLRKAIAKLNPCSTGSGRPLQYLVIRTPEGRWTALFHGDCQMLLGEGFPCIFSS